MTPQLPRWFYCGLAAACLVSAPAVARADYVVLDDPIPYASWGGSEPRMNSAWAQNTGNVPVVVGEPAPSENRLFTIANGVIVRPLGLTITEEFDFSIDVLHGAYARGIWAGLFNETGTEGYGVYWDSSSTGSQGNISIRRFAYPASNSLVFNSPGTAIGAATTSGRSPISGPLATLRLTWQRSTGALTLYVDGVQKLSRIDPSFGSFSRVFVSGNGTTAQPARFDNVVVKLRDEVPPQVAITAPAAGASLSGVVLMTADASDNLGVAGVQFQLDGVNFGPELTEPRYAIECDTDALAPGAHAITAIARDRVGNTTTSDAVAVTVAGHIAIGAWADAHVRSGAFAARNFGTAPTLETGRGDATDGTERLAYLKFELGHLDRIVEARLRLYGSQPGAAGDFGVHEVPFHHWQERGIRWVNRPDLAAEPVAVATVPAESGWVEWDVTPLLPADQHRRSCDLSLAVRSATEPAGLASFHAREHGENPPRLVLIPDRTAPQVAITRPLDGAVVSRMVPISAVAADNRGVAEVQFFMDGAPLGPVQTAAPFGLIWNSEDVAPGAHTLTAVAVDPAGNRTVSAPVQIQVSTTTPTGPVVQLEAEAFSAMSGAAPDLESVGDLNEGDWLRFRAVDLNQGYVTFQARLACVNQPADYGELELRLDAPDGPRVAVLRVLNTDGPASWDVQTTAITGGTGVHDLYVVARGGNGASVGTLDWIKLRRDMQPRGATMPFVTYEAEAGTYTGTLNGSSDAFYRYGASGRAYVWLDAPGEAVRWTAAAAANRLTLRYGLPQGTSGTVSVYVNDVLHVVPVVATHCYDASAVTTKPRRYDEVAVNVEIAAGDVITIEKGSADTLAWYAVDLVDLELAPPPATLPAEFLSVADFPRLDGETHDGPRIQRCIDAANAGSRKVFLPAGYYTTNTRIIIRPGIEFRGAGLWHTTLHNPTPGANTTGVAGFFIGSNATLADLKITGVATQRSNGVTSVRSLSAASGFTIEGVHIQNMGDLMGWEVFSHATFRDCRLIGTYFDGIHFGDGGVTDCLVDNCFFRGAGDDNVAQVNRADMTLCTRNVVQFITTVAQYSGRGVANIGGDTMVVSDSILESCFNAGVMIATEPLAPSVSRPIRGFKVQRTSVIRAGHPASVLPATSNHGAIHFWLARNPVQDVRIEDCLILDGDTKGVRIDDTDHGDALGRTQFNYNVMSGHPQGEFDDASPEVEPVLTGNTL